MARVGRPCGFAVGDDELLEPRLQQAADWRPRRLVRVDGVAVASNLHVLDEIEAAWIERGPEAVERRLDLAIGMAAVVDDDVEAPAALAHPPRDHGRVALVAMHRAGDAA